MKYCSHCGNELLDAAIVCPNCSYSFDNVAHSNSTSKNPYSTISGLCFGLTAVVYFVLLCTSDLGSILRNLDVVHLNYFNYATLLLMPLGFILLAFAFFSQSKKNILYVLGFIIVSLRDFRSILIMFESFVDIGATFSFKMILVHLLICVASLVAIFLICNNKKTYNKYIWIIPSVLCLISFLLSFTFIFYSNIEFQSTYLGLTIGLYFVYLLNTRANPSPSTTSNIAPKEEHDVMKYCTHCGKELLTAAVICPGCGCPVDGAKATQRDIPNKGLNILAFFVPLAGLIMYCIMLNSTPKKAKQIGKNALIGFIITVVAYSLLLSVSFYL